MEDKKWLSSENHSIPKMKPFAGLLMTVDNPVFYLVASSISNLFFDFILQKIEAASHIETTRNFLPMIVKSLVENRQDFLAINNRRKIPSFQFRNRP